MPRPLRLEHPGALWHVHNRGVERRDVYLDEADRSAFFDLLASTIETYRWRVHAYVLMTNHFHLLIETPQPTLSRGMQFLTGEYADQFNHAHARSGHLFQGRFSSHLVEKESYLLEVSRYIILNPVRAGMVDSAGQWPWSSYRATAALAPPPPWLQIEAILDSFDAWDRVLAHKLYRRFVGEGVGLTRSPWEDLVAGLYLGGAAFISRVEELGQAQGWTSEHNVTQKNLTAVTLADVRTVIESAFGISIDVRGWKSEQARLAFALLARRRAVARFGEMAFLLGLSTSGAHAMYQRAGQRFARDRAFRKLVEEVLVRISQWKVCV